MGRSSAAKQTKRQREHRVRRQVERSTANQHRDKYADKTRKENRDA